MPTTVVLFSDTHCGHRLGLLPPGVELYDEDEEGHPIRYFPKLTKTQEYLWRRFERWLGEIQDLANGQRIVVIHCGDLTHGKTYPFQLVSTREADQLLIAMEVLRRAVAVSGSEVLRLISGTGSHTFGEGTAGLLVSTMLQKEYPRLDIAFRNHGLFTIDGVRFDVAHHGPSPGIRWWTSGNQLRYYTRSLQADAFADGESPPDVVVRGHYHTYCWETIRAGTAWGDVVTEAFVLPSFCGLSEYGRQATRSAYRIGCGFLVVQVDQGQIRRIEPLVEIKDLRTEEEL